MVDEKLIREVEEFLNQLKKQRKEELELQYINSPHKKFDVGDWVFKGNEFGQIRWVENKNANIKETDGYAGISLYSGSRGFYVGKRDEWFIMSPSDKEYLTTMHNVPLTGEDILKIISYCQNDDYLVKLLKDIGNFSIFSNENKINLK